MIDVAAFKYRAFISYSHADSYFLLAPPVFRDRDGVLAKLDQIGAAPRRAFKSSRRRTDKSA